MQRVGEIVSEPATIYLTGGATAVLLGFREGTIDIDIAGELDQLFGEIPALKRTLNINVEIAKPTDFVPVLAGETERHIFIGTFGEASFYHFDPYGQVFSKVVRAHATDLHDAKAFVSRELVELSRLFELVKQVPDAVFARYTRLDRESVERAVQDFLRI